MADAPEPRLTGLAVDGLINAQATAILVDSDLFEPTRLLAGRLLPPPLNELLTCYVCTGMWVGILQAAIKGGPPLRFVRRALAIACAGRLVRILAERHA